MTPQSEWRPVSCLSLVFLPTTTCIMKNQRVVLLVYSEVGRLLSHNIARVIHLMWNADDFIFLDFVLPTASAKNTPRNIEKHTPSNYNGHMTIFPVQYVRFNQIEDFLPWFQFVTLNSVNCCYYMFDCLSMLCKNVCRSFFTSLRTAELCGVERMT